MTILDYVEFTNLTVRSEAERAKLLCYYYYKEDNKALFSMTEISEYMTNAGFNKPNLTRLKDSLIKGANKTFIVSKINKGMLEFIPVILQSLDKALCGAWKDTETIHSNSELIEENKFCGKRKYVDRLIKQINFTYANNCFDACAVLMRRLFEVLLILSYQKLGIEKEITNAQGNHFGLESVVKDAMQNKVLNLSSRVSKNLNSFREVGNNSAHSITYTAGQKDIDDIKTNYRVMLEELFNKAGLI